MLLERTEKQRQPKDKSCFDYLRILTLYFSFVLFVLRKFFAVSWLSIHMGLSTWILKCATIVSIISFFSDTVLPITLNQMILYSYQMREIANLTIFIFDDITTTAFDGKLSDDSNRSTKTFNVDCFETLITQNNTDFSHAKTVKTLRQNRFRLILPFTMLNKTADIWTAACACCTTT